MMRMGLNLFSRPRHKHQTTAERRELREDATKRRLDRQQQGLVEREQALNERERNVRRKERAIESEQQGSSSSEESRPDHSAPPSIPGATAPGRTVNATARMILQADAIRRGAVAAAAVPLPTDPTARMIASFARGTAQVQQPQLSPAARMILNADKMRNGGDIDEAV